MAAQLHGSDRLHVAAYIGNHEEVERLLGPINSILQNLGEEGINVNQPHCSGASPLYIACQQGHERVVEVLLKHKDIQVNRVTSTWPSGLYIAAQKGHHQVVELLLSMEGIRVNVGTDSGATPLLVACQNGHVEVVDLLLRREDVDVNRSTTCKMTAANNGVTPLFAAATHGHDRVVEMLLDRGDIQVNKARIDGCTPLAMALQRGHGEVAHLIKLKLIWPQSTREQVCIVCMDKGAEVVLIPCGHRNLCWDCACAWDCDNGNGCPMDRMQVSEIASILKEEDIE